MLENRLPDAYLWSKDTQVLTPNEHGIPSLGSIVHRVAATATPPAAMHYHDHMLEIYCITKGTRFTQISVNGEILDYTTSGNEVLLTYPYEMHCNGEEALAPSESYAVQLNVSDPDALLCLDALSSRRLYELLTTLPSRHISLEPRQMAEIRSIFNLFAAQDEVSHLRGAQYFAGFLFGLAAGTPLYGDETRRLDPRIAAAITYLGENLSEPLRLQDLADAAGYSLSRFKARFKEEVGITPADYVTIRKIEEAKKRLTTSSVSVTELAYGLGFSSSNYFCSVFKKIVGCSPLQYRNRQG